MLLANNVLVESLKDVTRCLGPVGRRRGFCAIVSDDVMTSDDAFVADEHTLARASDQALHLSLRLRAE